MSGFIQNKWNPSGDGGSITTEDVKALLDRDLLLSTNIVDSSSDSIEFPTVFADNPSYDYFEVDLDFAHVYSGVNTLYFRYFVDGSEHITNYGYGVSQMANTTPTGGFGTTQNKVTLGANFASNRSHSARLRMGPNNTLKDVNGAGAYNRKHPLSFKAVDTGTTYYHKWAIGGTESPTGPDTVSGFNMFWGSVGWSSGSKISVYGVKNQTAWVV